jgi:hypothetical protein
MPAAGSGFAGWGGDCADTPVTADCVVTVVADTSVSASFTQQYQLAVTRDGGGTGTVSGSGIDCGITCVVMLDEGIEATLTATPAAGSVFTGWGGACDGTPVTADCVVRVDADTNVSATFVPATQQYTLTVTQSGSGRVTSSPKGINCGKHCTSTFGVGTSVTLTAKPTGKKHQFLGWSGACSGSGTALTCTVPMLSDQSVGAVFN